MTHFIVYRESRYKIVNQAYDVYNFERSEYCKAPVFWQSDFSVPKYESLFVVTTRARGVAWLTRLPVTEEIAGSNPVGPAKAR